MSRRHRYSHRQVLSAPVDPTLYDARLEDKAIAAAVQTALHDEFGLDIGKTGVDRNFGPNSRRALGTLTQDERMSLIAAKEKELYPERFYQGVTDKADLADSTYVMRVQQKIHEQATARGQTADLGQDGPNGDGVTAKYNAKTDAALMAMSPQDRAALLAEARQDADRIDGKDVARAQASLEDAFGKLPNAAKQMDEAGAKQQLTAMAEEAKARAKAEAEQKAKAEAKAKADAEAKAKAAEKAKTAKQSVAKHKSLPQSSKQSWTNFSPDRALSADQTHAGDFAAAWERHQNQSKPSLVLDGKRKSWSDTVAAIRAEPNEAKKLQMANDAINQSFRYGGTYENSGPNKRWISTPFEATHPKSVVDHSICGDIAAAKVFLLKEAGVPASQMGLVTVAPIDGGNYHVVAGFKGSNGEVYGLEMNRVSGPGAVVKINDPKTHKFGMAQRPISRVVPATILDWEQSPKISAKAVVPPAAPAAKVMGNNI